MAYSGYLVKVGNYKIPLKYFKAETLKSVIHVQDLDPYTNANGVTFRNALKNKKPTIEWTVPSLSADELSDLMENINANYISELERSSNVTAFFPEIGSYKTYKCYITDPEITIDRIVDGEPMYKEFSIKFIAYGGEAS